MTKFQLVQRNGFIVIGNDHFAVFGKQINFVNHIISGQLDSTNAESSFFLFWYFIDVESEEDSIFGS